MSFGPETAPGATAACVTVFFFSIPAASAPDVPAGMSWEAT
jgi:hypothetical protein